MEANAVGPAERNARGRNYYGKEDIKPKYRHVIFQKITSVPLVRQGKFYIKRPNKLNDTKQG